MLEGRYLRFLILWVVTSDDRLHQFPGIQLIYLVRKKNKFELISFYIYILTLIPFRKADGRRPINQTCRTRRTTSFSQEISNGHNLAFTSRTCARKFLKTRGQTIRMTSEEVSKRKTRKRFDVPSATRLEKNHYINH